MNLLIYTFILIIVTAVAYIAEYTSTTINSREQQVAGRIDVSNEEKTPWINILFITIILSLYSSYLATSGKLSDTVGYAWSFLYRYPVYYDSTLEDILETGTEVGYLLINLFIGNVTDEPYWLFFSIAFITTFINLYTARKISGKYTFIIFLYLISLYYFQTTYLLKQTIAVSFVNLALLSYLRGLKFRYFLFSILALAFHATAIILIPIFFIFKITKTKKVYFYMVVVFFLVFFLFGAVFNTLLPNIPYIDQYLNTQEIDVSSGQGSLAAIFKALPFYLVTLLALKNRKSLNQIMYKADFYITCSILYSMTWLLSYNMYWFFRIGLYFLLPTLALVPSLFSIIKNKKERVLYYILFIFMLIIVTYRQIYITLN